MTSVFDPPTLRIRSKKYDSTLDIALGKSLNRMRGIEMSGLRPEEFLPGYETDRGVLDRELTEQELGYVSIDELQSIKGWGGLGIERDKFFKPTAFKDIKGVR